MHNGESDIFIANIELPFQIMNGEIKIYNDRTTYIFKKVDELPPIQTNGNKSLTTNFANVFASSSKLNHDIQNVNTSHTMPMSDIPINHSKIQPCINNDETLVSNQNMKKENDFTPFIPHNYNRNSKKFSINTTFKNRKMNLHRTAKNIHE
jgi:hypothetical protein